MGDIFKRGNFDYVKTTNPTGDVNPGFVGATWLNLTTGEVFVAIDKSVGSNVWRGQRGHAIPDNTLEDWNWLPVTLTNPGAELGDTTGWSGNLKYKSSFFSREGFCAGDAASPYSYQAVTVAAMGLSDLISTGRCLVRLKALRLDHTDGDRGQIGLRILNSSTIVLEQILSIMKNYNSTVYGGIWQQEVIYAVLPPETNSLRVEMLGSRVSGTECSSFFDDFQLDVLCF